jgi:SAM-dependent methyltransferase
MVSTFDEVDLVGGFDVITFVHSMYYVPGVAETVRAAYDLLAPGGALFVLSAPRGGLNRLSSSGTPSTSTA